MKQTGNLIVDLTFQFALDVTEFTEGLIEMKRFALANQLFKSGTSVGANVREAQAPQSRKDFIHKLKLSEKELNETDFWMDICRYSSHLPSPPEKMFADAKSIRKVMGKILASTYRGGQDQEEQAS